MAPEVDSEVLVGDRADVAGVGHSHRLALRRPGEQGRLVTSRISQLLRGGRPTRDQSLWRCVARAETVDTCNRTSGVRS